MGARDRFSATSAEWLTRKLASIPPAEIERISRHILTAVDDASLHRWEAAKARAAATEGGIRPEKIANLTAAFTRELATAGAAAGAAAAAPTVGTMATLAATAAELGWFTARAGDLILTIAALHGRPDPTIDERRAWVLAVLIYGSSARDEFARAVNQASTGVAPVVADRRIALTTLQTANRLMSKAIVRRYGTRRGAVALGRTLPAGIGAVIGFSANYVAIRTLARHADAFFATLPYSAIDVDSTDITDRQLGSLT